MEVSREIKTLWDHNFSFLKSKNRELLEIDSYLFGELINNKIWEEKIGNTWRCSKSNSNRLIFPFPLFHHIGKSHFSISTYREEVLQQIDFFLFPFPPPVMWGQLVIVCALKKTCHRLLPCRRRHRPRLLQRCQALSELPGACTLQRAQQGKQQSALAKGAALIRSTQRLAASGGALAQHAGRAAEGTREPRTRPGSVHAAAGGKQWRSRAASRQSSWQTRRRGTAGGRAALPTRNTSCEIKIHFCSGEFFGNILGCRAVRKLEGGDETTNS